MNNQEILNLAKKLDVAGTLEEENTWLQLKPHGIELMPVFLQLYPTFKKWQGRCSLVFHSIKFARISEEAFQLGLLACNDKSKVVRYRACSLLAYSLRNEALPVLQKIMQSFTDTDTLENARAALDAIQNKNHHFFYDRNHSGKMTWTVNPEDRSS